MLGLQTEQMCVVF